MTHLDTKILRESKVVESTRKGPGRDGEKSCRGVWFYVPRIYAQEGYGTTGLTEMKNKIKA